MAAHLTMEQRQLARRLDAKGLSLREIGRRSAASTKSSEPWYAASRSTPCPPMRGGRARPPAPGGSRLRTHQRPRPKSPKQTPPAQPLHRRGTCHRIRPLRVRMLGALRPAEPPGDLGCPRAGRPPVTHRMPPDRARLVQVVPLESSPVHVVLDSRLVGCGSRSFASVAPYESPPDQSGRLDR